MNSRERFLKTMKGEMADRVPVTLFIVDQGHFIHQVYPDIDKNDHIQTQLKIIEIQKQLGADVFVRLLYGVVPLWLIYGGVNTETETENWEVHTKEFEKGKSIIKKSTIKTPKGVITQEFTTSEITPGTYVYACTDLPVKTEKDLDIIIAHEPRMSPLFPEKTKKIVSIVKNKLGDNGIVGAWAPHGPFNNGSLLIKLDMLYALFLTDFKFYDKLMIFSIDRFKDYAKAIGNSGVDVQCVGANVAGGFLGKKIFDQYVLPYEKKYMDIVQSQGIPAIYHNCGEIMNLVESYIEIGPKIIEPFSPRPIGDGDLADAKKRSKGKFIIIGNIDQVNVLKAGPIDKIKKVTKETLEIGKINGKFILQSADFIEYNTPLENLEAFIATGIEYGGLNE